MKLGFNASEVVTSSRGKRVLFGAHNHTVVVCDLVRGIECTRFETTFDGGGQRLALSDELDGVVAGAYNLHGLAFYSCATGREVWRRRDLKRVQYITLSRDGRTAYCGMQGTSLAVVDLRTGETRRRVRGARALHDSAFEKVQFIESIRPQLVDRSGERKFRMERHRSGFLDIVFAPGLLCVSEMGGPVRCLDIRTGQERWRYQPRTGRHVLNLGYRKSAKSIVGIEWPFENGGNHRLLQWSLDDGSIIRSSKLGVGCHCSIAMAGEVVVTAMGHILDATTGAARRK